MYKLLLTWSLHTALRSAGCVSPHSPYQPQPALQSLLQWCSAALSTEQLDRKIIDSRQMLECDNFTLQVSEPRAGATSDPSPGLIFATWDTSG